jgi:pimeloyl-ACP methyl ester carboxylesterase
MQPINKPSVVTPKGTQSILSRRNAILGGIAAALGFGYGLSRWDQTLPPRDQGAEERYRIRQDALLRSQGTNFKSVYFEISNPKLRVHVLEAGNGEPVLMLHGGDGVAAQWFPLFGRLQQKFHVFAPDRPGCGLTQMFNYNDNPVSFRDHAVAFVESTMDVLGLRAANIIANSMGGYFALVFALAHPERVSRMVTIGEPAGSSNSRPIAIRLQSMRGVNRLLYATVMRPGDASTREAFQRLLVADIGHVPQAYLDCNTAAALIPGATESWLTMLQNVGPMTYSLRPELKELRMPVLMIWGDKDMFGPPSEGAEMAALMPNAKLAVLHNAGHLAWLDQPEQCEQLVSEFLRV